MAALAVNVDSIARGIAGTILGFEHDIFNMVSIGGFNMIGIGTGS